MASMEDEIKANTTVYNEIKAKFGELYKFLSEVVSGTPRYLIIIDKETDELRELKTSNIGQHLEVIRIQNI